MIWFVMLLLVGELDSGFSSPHSIGSELVERWVVGDGSDLFFSGNLSLAADDNGGCYALDRSEGQIYFFNSDGKMVRTFGQKGRGPGELSEPDAITLTSEGTLLVLDSSIKKILLFSPDGVFITESRLPINLQKIFRVEKISDQFLISGMRSNDQFQLRYELALLSQDMLPVRIFYTKQMEPMEGFRNQGNNPAYWVGYLKNRFKSAVTGIPSFAILDANTLVVTPGGEVKGLICDASGQQLSRLKKEFSPIPFPASSRRIALEALWTDMMNSPFMARRITQTIFEKALAEADLPDYLPPVSALFSMGDGFAIIEGYNLVKSEGRLVFFDRLGKSSGWVPYRGTLGYFEGEQQFLFVAGYDNDGVMMLRCLELVSKS